MLNLQGFAFSWMDLSKEVSPRLLITNWIMDYRDFDKNNYGRRGGESLIRRKIILCASKRQDG